MRRGPLRACLRATIRPRLLLRASVGFLVDHPSRLVHARTFGCQDVPASTTPIMIIGRQCQSAPRFAMYADEHGAPRPISEPPHPPARQDAGLFERLLAQRPPLRGRGPRAPFATTDTPAVAAATAPDAAPLAPTRHPWARECPFELDEGIGKHSRADTDALARTGVEVDGELFGVKIHLAVCGDGDLLRSA